MHLLKLYSYTFLLLFNGPERGRSLFLKDDPQVVTPTEADFAKAMKDELYELCFGKSKCQ